MPPTAKPTVGFIGLGLMGRPMALNLLKAGYAVTVWNRTRSRAEALASEGATLAATPRETAAGADVVFMIVSDPPAVESVLWGAEGALSGLRKGMVLVDSSTVSPDLARKSAAACAERGVEYLDAPVTGGTWGAEKGELVFMVGGTAATLARVEPLLSVMGKRWFLLGPNGAGQTIKLAMNLVLALEVQAFAEALAIVKTAGLPGERLVEVMQSSMGRAPVLDVKAPVMLSGDYKASFPLRLMYKDVALALDLARELKLTLPAGAAARDTYGSVRSASNDDPDYAAVARFFDKR
ncbi:MAG: NAD(P)-dependent oxidoreductase [Candidatus Acidiferrales bacterium]